MKALIPNIDITNVLPTGKKVKFLKNYLYIITEQFEYIFRSMFVNNNENFDKYIKTMPLDEIIQPFDFINSNKNIHKVIIIRSGGIGDILATSAIQNFISQHNYNTGFITLDKYTDVLKWFRYIPDIYSYYQPVDRYKFLKFKNTAQIRLQGIVDNTRLNWYEVIAEKANIPFSVELGRPKLQPFAFTEIPKMIIISHRASTNIRSMKFIDIYTALIKIIDRRKKYSICVFKSDLTYNDIKVLPDDITILPITNDICWYFNLLASAFLVISTDTAAIHFREGIAKPAIGIFNAMTTASRTMYYKYTHSFNIKSNCPLQPCFCHNTKGKDEVCPKAVIGSTIAPCLDTAVYTPDLYKQLYNNMIDYINNL